MSLLDRIESSKSFVPGRCLALGVVGPSGSGKSSLLGTADKKTLYAFFGAETHGVVAAKEARDRLGLKHEIIPYRVDNPNNSPDANLDNFIMDIPKLKELGVEFLVIDSATQLVNFFKTTNEFIQGCKTHDGKHNSFKEGGVVLGMWNQLHHTLNDAQLNFNLDFAITIMADVTEIDPVDGSFNEVSPSISTYKVGEGILQALPDVVVIGPVTQSKVVNKVLVTDTNFMLQFATSVGQKQLDENKKIKRFYNFRTRVLGASQGLPDISPAHLSEIYKLKSV